MKQIKKIKRSIRKFFVTNVETRIPVLSPIFNFLFGPNEKIIAKNRKYTDYIDVTKSIEEKIEFEKRRRESFYTALDFYSNSYSIYDYFTVDALKIIEEAYVLTSFLKRKRIKTDCLFLAFCSHEGTVSAILKKYGITKKEIEKILSLSVSVESTTIKENFFQRIQKKGLGSLFNPSMPVFKEKEKIEFSKELERLLLLASENAIFEYKTPIISTEILFLTLIDEKIRKNLNQIFSFFKEEDEFIWFSIRYELLVCLYHDEIAIRTQIPSNEYQYAYFFKANCSELFFKKMLVSQRLSAVMEQFREELFALFLPLNFYDLLKEDIQRTIRMNCAKTTRRYYENEITEETK